MKTIAGAFALLLIVSGMSVTAGHAQGHNPVENSTRLRAMRKNALDAAANAGIYQWKRVNREVDRIAADADKIAAQSPPVVMPEGRELQQATRELRSARLQRNPEHIVRAAQRIVSLCDALLAGK